MNQNIYIFFNYLSAFLFSLSTIYQIYRVLKADTTKGIMLTTVIIRLCAFCVFLPYLVHYMVWHTVYTVSFQGCITIFLIILVCYYRYWKRVDDVDLTQYLLQN